MSGFDSGDRYEGLLERWRPIELFAGIVLIAVGFLAVFLAWMDASATAEVHRQLQALISGGFGGLALLLLGSTMVHAHVASASARRLGHKLDRVADAVLDLAYREDAGAAEAAMAGSGDEIVLASNASYHLPECDLVEGRAGLREVPLTEVAFSDLKPCGVCKPRTRMLA